MATATIVAVYPANIKAAVDAGPPVNPVAALTWLRLPFQVPLFTWALGHAGLSPAAQGTRPRHGRPDGQRRLRPGSG